MLRQWPKGERPIQPSRACISLASVSYRIAGITSELTRRREFIQASPDQLSYETRSRRSRPTICYGAPERRQAFNGFAVLTHSLHHDEPSANMTSVSRICAVVMVD